MSSELDALIASAAAAVKAGEVAEARRMLDDVRGRDPLPSVLLVRTEASCARAEGRHRLAIRVLEAGDAALGLPARDLLTYGRLLADVGRIREGTAVIVRQVDRVTRKGPALMALARLHGQLEDYASAIAFWTRALDYESSEDRVLEIRGQRAALNVTRGDHAGAALDFEVLNARYPGSPAGLAGLFDIALEQGDRSAAEHLLETGETRFPRAREFLIRRARLLHRFGDEDALVAQAAVFAASAHPERDRVRAAIELLGTRKVYMSDALRERIAAPFRNGSAESEDLLRALEKPDRETVLARIDRDLERIGDRRDGPAGVELRQRRIRTLVPLARFDEAAAEARALADAVADWPALPGSVSEVLEWHHAREGRLQRARQAYFRRTRRHADRDKRSDLTPVRQPAGAMPDVVVFAQMRDEIDLVDPFLAHYRALGVTRFVIIDNASEDGTGERLAAEGDVELYRTEAPYRRARGGNDWINPIIAESRFAGSLCLRVDADEFLVYAGCETRPLSEVWDYMCAEGADVLAGAMVDLFPATLADLETGPGWREALWFDPAAQRMPGIFSPYWMVTGGVRARLLDGKHQVLAKAPGIRGGGDMEFTGAAHTTSPGWVADLPIALLHYKMRPGFAQRVDRAIAWKQHAKSAQEYMRYRTLAALDTDLRGPESRPYLGPASLMEAGILATTPGWDQFHATARKRAGNG